MAASWPYELELVLDAEAVRAWPRQDYPLPKTLGDAAAAKLLRAAHTEPRLVTRITVEVLWRTALRVSEFIALRSDAVVVIGAAPWTGTPSPGS